MPLLSKKRLTDSSIEALKKAPSGERLRVMDSVVTNFGVSVTDKGTKTFFLVARFPGGSGPSRRELGKVSNISLADARDKARKWNRLIAEGRDPGKVEEGERRAQLKKDATTVEAVLDAFEKDHVEGLRTGDNVKAAFKLHVRPTLGHRSIYELKRSDITTMLNKIKSDSGPVAADRVLAYVRKAFNWQMIQDDDFKSPIVRGMAKTKPKERARKRVLSDEEIRDVWAALVTAPGLPSCYSRFVKSLLLCATRRNESAFMTSTEINDNNWTIPGDRYKNKLDHVIPLTTEALALIGEKPAGIKSNSWFVFSTTAGKKGFSGFSKAKQSLDAEIAKRRKADGRDAMPNWTLHDLRRTARSLMSRAKVPSDHAERCMGHVIGGVRETYDRYEYLDEKRKAFEALAGLVELILKPPADNVVHISAAQ